MNIAFWQLQTFLSISLHKTDDFEKLIKVLKLVKKSLLLALFYS